MKYAIRGGLTYCIIDGTALFLDLPRDRYLRLSTAANAAFCGWHDGGTPTQTEWRALDAAGILVAGDTGSPANAASASTVRRCHPGIAAGPFVFSELARALWMQRKVERRIRSKGLQRMIEDLQRLRQAGGKVELQESRCGQAVLRAFEVARLLRGSSDTCLPRSIAIVLCLARHGIRAEVVLGVKLGPFAAHAWACKDGDVLNDTAEEIARFTPILVA